MSASLLPSLPLAQSDVTPALSPEMPQVHISPVLGIVWLAAAVFVIIGVWKVFTKAGQPGWASIVPFYNLYILLKLAGKPGWWLILFLIPLVNIVIYILLCVALAESFGKGGGFAVGLFFLGFIFYPILGFGSAQYVGPRAASI